MKLLLAMLATLVGALVWAQTPEIRGVVIEPGIEHGVPDADIAIYELGGSPVTPFGNQAQTLKRRVGGVTTDSQGKFRFQPEQFGDYQVIASKEGYSGNATRASVTLSADHPGREVLFLLGRTGEITGRVLDDETSEPLANYTIEAVGFFYKNGVPRTAGSATLANTDNDGRFTVPDLDPGRYVVVTHPRMRGLTRFSDDELKTQDYERPIGREVTDWTPPHQLRSFPAARPMWEHSNCARRPYTGFKSRFRMRIARRMRGCRLRRLRSPARSPRNTAPAKAAAARN